MDQDTEHQFKLTNTNQVINYQIKLLDYNYMEHSFTGMCRQADMFKKEKISDY